MLPQPAGTLPPCRVRVSIGRTRPAGLGGTGGGARKVRSITEGFSDEQTSMATLCNFFCCFSEGAQPVAEDADLGWLGVEAGLVCREKQVLVPDRGEDRLG